MRKLDIAHAVAEESGLPLSEALRIVEEVLHLIIDTVRRGESVMISGFGAFHVRQKLARQGRNPRTGETIPITPRRIVQFRASQQLKQAVAEVPGAVSSHDQKASPAVVETPPCLP